MVGKGAVVWLSDLGGGHKSMSQAYGGELVVEQREAATAGNLGFAAGRHLGERNVRRP